MMEHTYFVPKHRRVYGTHAADRDVVALLYALYMRYATDHVGRYDAASLCNGDNGIIKLENRMRVVVGCDGSGTGRVIEHTADGKSKQP